jgi:chemotaxis protein CheX
MNVELINPFVLSAHEVFRTVLNTDLRRGTLALKRSNTPMYEISGVVGLSGKVQGMVVLSLSRETAIRGTEIMLGACPDDLNADVIDAVGELANMIAGAAKAQLEQYQLSISLPSIICGKNHAVAFPSQTQPLVIPFESDIGPVCIDVGLTSLSAGA